VGGGSPYANKYVTREHFFFVKRALAYLALGIFGGGAAVGGGVWIREGLMLKVWCLRK